MFKLRYDEKLWRGFHMTFDNGYTLSVQWGYGNYCENRHQARDESVTAEIAVIKPNGDFMRLEGEGDDVVGWQTPDDVAQLMAYVAGL